MLKRQWLWTVCAAVGLLALTSASAQAQVVQVSRGRDSRQAIGFTIGGFFPRGEDTRDHQDTILADLDDLAIEVKDFRNVTFGGEYVYAVNDFLEAGVGIGYYSKAVDSVYANFVNTDGSEIEQELKLRIVPITATLRFLPIGRTAQSSRMSAGAWASSTGVTRRSAISSTSATTASTPTAPIPSSPTARHSVPWCSAGCGSPLAMR